MPFQGRSAGLFRRPQWPLALAWAVSVAGLLAVALLPRAQAHALGAFLLAGSAGSLIVVVAYARLLNRGTPPRTVLLVGGPWEGQVLLPVTGPVPQEVWLAALGAPACCYRHRPDDRDRGRLRVLRYESVGGAGPDAGLQRPA
jgi:hypothetical protein